MNDLRVLDLFSGIGGMSLGLEGAGMRTVAFCEIEPYPRRILRRHWPTVPLFEDVRTLSGRRLRKEGIEPNVIAGGFPCQDISTAGKGRGIEGERSGLWKEMLRLIREIKPLWVLAENVPALRTRGADVVLADLERAGYTAWPILVGAWAVGAPHQRNRVWIVAHSHKVGRRNRGRYSGDGSSGTSSSDPGSRGPDAGPLADTNPPQQQSGFISIIPGRPMSGAIGDHHDWNATQPPVLGMADGVPNRLDRLRGIGNAVVPQIVELIGRAIRTFHESAHS